MHRGSKENKMPARLWSPPAALHQGGHGLALGARKPASGGRRSAGRAQKRPPLRLTGLVVSKGYKQGAMPPFQRSALNFNLCARFVLHAPPLSVFLSRAIDETDSRPVIAKALGLVSIKERCDSSVRPVFFLFCIYMCVLRTSDPRRGREMQPVDHRRASAIHSC